MYECTCGITKTDVQPRSGLDKCPACRTFPMLDLGVRVGHDEGHRWSGDEQSDFRCYWCDTRHGSHRMYPGDFEYERIVKRAAESIGFVAA